jgi:hypothetical protein
MEENAQLYAHKKEMLVPSEHKASLASDWSVRTVWRKEKSDGVWSVVHTTAKGLQGRRSNGFTDTCKFSNQTSYLRLCFVFISLRF